MRRVLITGASRGIGLGLSRLFAAQPDTLVFAGCRKPEVASGLRELERRLPDRIRVVPLDVSDRAGMESARDAVAPAGGLDILVNNAGIYPGSVSATPPETSTLGSLDADAMIEVFRINAVAPVIVTQTFLALLRSGDRPRVINVSSDAGSIALRTGTGSYAYTASKAALNMLTRCLAADLRPMGIVVAAVHPGFIRTDMGGPSAPLAPAQTLPSLLRVIEDLRMESTGSFLNWDGAAIPW
jgi:NAD(P)-dependent dehydrogenase (short-subunit alcohol dehydrogenase family)